MMVVSTSPVCGWNMVPRIMRPRMNISRTEAINSAPRQGRFNRKWPAPGISQARKTVPYHPAAGADAGCTFALVAIVSSVPDPVIRATNASELALYLRQGAQLFHHVRQERLSIAKQHQRIVAIVQFVVDTGESGIHAALNHHHRSRFVGLNNGHAGDGALG